MKKILLPLFVLATCYSCKKSGNPASTVTKSLPDSNIVVSTTKPGPPSSLSNADKTYNLLGFGYDITGKYADTSAVRSQAINVTAYDINNPGRFVPDLSKTATTNLINSENAESFSEKLGFYLSELHGIKQFKGSLVSPFPDVNALSAQFVYGNFAVVIQQKRVKMVSNYDLLKNYLTVQFRQDIKDLNAADLVKKYGTHVLCDIALGAKLSVTYQAKTAATDRLASETAGFRYSLGKVFGLSTGALDPINNADLNSISSPKLFYEAVGADQSLLKLNTTAKIPTLNINDWHRSSTEASAVFIDISPDGLMPLYNLIADPVKQSAVKDYIASYLIAQQVKLIN